MAIDFDKIALDYAKSIGHDLVRFAGEQNGYRYYHTDRFKRPRYLGNPHIIKINSVRVVFEVIELAELLNAYKRATKLSK